MQEGEAEAEGEEQRRLDRRIAALADRFYGVVDVDQLRALGASRRQIGDRIDSGRLVRLHRGVYAVGHRQLTRPGWWLAAVRAIGPGAVLSHISAAALWDLRPGHDGRPHVTVASRGRRPRKGIVIHVTRDLPPDHVTTHLGIPVTTATRTLVDLAAAIPRPQLTRALEAAEIKLCLDVPSLLAVSAGRAGATTLKALLEKGPTFTRSDFEAAFLDLCDRHGIPRPHMNTTLHGYLVDAVWPERKLIVELDSWRFHGTREAFERDKERDADLHALGLTTLRFTYRQVTTRSHWVAAKLASRSPRGSSASRRSGG